MACTWHSQRWVSPDSLWGWERPCHAWHMGHMGHWHRKQPTHTWPLGWEEITLRLTRVSRASPTTPLEHPWGTPSTALLRASHGSMLPGDRVPPSNRAQAHSRLQACQ